MDYDAFFAGFGEVLVKSSGFTDGVTSWMRHNVFQPAAQGVIDQHYRGLGTYNPDSNSVEPNTMNAIRAVTDVSPVDHPPDNFLQKRLYNLGRTSPAKWITNKFITSDQEIGDRMTKSTNGVFSMSNTGVKDRKSTRLNSSHT